MLSHQARKHPETRPTPTVLTAEQYASQTVDGMRCCVHCGRTFTRVEGLKKHLKRQCRQRPAMPEESLNTRAHGEAAASVVAQVPTPRREPPRDRSPYAASLKPEPPLDTPHSSQPEPVETAPFTQGLVHDVEAAASNLLEVGAARLEDPCSIAELLCSLRTMGCHEGSRYQAACSIDASGHP